VPININKKNELEILQECKKQFCENTVVSLEQKRRCLEFASRIYDENDNDAVHNPAAFGGEEKRAKNEIFVNTFQGKIAEYGFYNYFKHRVEIKEPDMDLWGKGEWEDTDFIVTYKDIDYRISIKSTKSYGNLLLLESDRYDTEGRYLESVEGEEPKQHDWIFLVRVKGIDSDNPTEYTDEILENISVEISGYIGKNIFRHAIKTKKILKKDTTIGNMPLKVDNYWFCLTELLDPAAKHKS